MSKINCQSDLSSGTHAKKNRGANMSNLIAKTLIDPDYGVILP
jgi:hypothetical protein